MDMIAERARKTPSLPSVHVFTTFFFPKFQKEGYSNMIKRWTRKVDIFSFDLLIFPIHLGVHWCCATADFRKKEIKFFDSLLGGNMNNIKVSWTNVSVCGFLFLKREYVDLFCIYAFDSRLSCSTSPVKCRSGRRSR